MSTLFVIIGMGVAVLIFDTVASLIFSSNPANYRKLAFMSIVLYTLAGTIAGRLAEGDVVARLLHAALAGAAVAAVESTLGWWISYTIGPGKLPDELLKRFTSLKAAVVRVLVMNIVVGVFVGIIGGAWSLLLRG